MTSPEPAPPRWWSVVWRLGFAVVVGLAAGAVQYGTLVEDLGPDPSDSIRLGVLMAVDLLVAPAAIGLLVLRRRPVAGAVVVLLSAFSTLSVGAGLLATVSFAAAQPARRVVALGLAFTGLATVALLVTPGPAFPLWAEALVVAALYVVLVLVGLYVRSRRELVASLQAQAWSTVREQEAREESARSAERSRIAREMHDALGHRLSVIAMHTGALESRADLSTDDRRIAAGVVRENARQAMDELRQVLGVLNEAPTDRTDGSDVPTLAGLDALVAAGVGDGVVPRLRCDLAVDAVPETMSRHLYRIAQEALTNVRKHAPGQPTAVEVRRTTEGSVELVVCNRLAGPAGAPRSGTSTGHGLTGLAERARLAGGSVTAGPDGADFVVRAVLPCP